MPANYDMHCPVARTIGHHRRALDDPDPARPAARRIAQIPGFRAVAGWHQPEYAVRAAEAARGGRDRRAPFLRAAPAARRICSDAEGPGARPGVEGAARLGTQAHPPPLLTVPRRLAR